MSDSDSFIIRVRSRTGMWRFNVTKKTKIIDLRNRIFSEKGVKLSDQRLTLDQNGASPAADNAKLGALGLNHGDILYLLTDPNVTTGLTRSGVAKTIGKGGVIMEASYESTANKKGFRPGLRDLRSMKMHWTLAEFAALDSQYEFKVKAAKEAACKQVSLNSAACNVFQQYVRSYAFAPRCGYLLGRYDEEASRTIVDFIYEPKQHVDASGELCIDNDDLLEPALHIAKELGLIKVGWIFSHPKRTMSSSEDDDEYNDNDDDMGGADDYRFTAFELLEAAEQQIDSINGDLSKAENCKFVTVIVTANDDGHAEFDAFQCSPLCLQMTDAGALLEHEEKAGLCRVSETFTALVEGKKADYVSTNFFISVVAITQHTTKGISCTFPIANRQGNPEPLAALRARMVQMSRQPYGARLADLQALLALLPIMGLESVLELCKSVVDPNIAVKEGYRLILDSL
eukprot:g1818.t1